VIAARRGIFWPVVLIAVGAAFLAANFGLLPNVSPLVLLSLWPLLLILAGIDIAIRRSSSTSTAAPDDSP
jgi:hypothetical protein